MNAVRLLATVGVVASFALLTLQSGAFSSATAERSVSVAVADDENAYLGMQQSPVAVTGNRSRGVVLLTVTNRFPRPLDLAVRVTERNPSERPTVARVSGPDTLAPGAESTVTAVVTCANGTGSETATVSLSASSEGVSVTANRSVAVRCAGSAAPSPTHASGRNHTAATSTARKR